MFHIQAVRSSSEERNPASGIPLPIRHYAGYLRQHQGPGGRLGRSSRTPDGTIAILSGNYSCDILKLEKDFSIFVLEIFVINNL